jgi:hypothetical protein
VRLDAPQFNMNQKDKNCKLVNYDVPIRSLIQPIKCVRSILETVDGGCINESNLC